MAEILDFQAGREARINGRPRDGRRNSDWLRGWDIVEMQERAVTTVLEKRFGYVLPTPANPESYHHHG